MTIRPLLLAAALMASAPAAAAPCEPGAFCTCATGDVARTFASADAVFRGTVVALGEADTVDGQRYVVHVERSWKGSPGPRVLVSEPMYQTCPLFLEEGRSYLLTAHRGETGTMRVSYCFRIREADEASLGPPAWTNPAPVPPVPGLVRVARAELAREVLRQLQPLLKPDTFASVRLLADGAVSDEIAAALGVDPRVYVLRYRPDGETEVLPDRATRPGRWWFGARRGPETFRVEVTARDGRLLAAIRRPGSWHPAVTVEAPR